MKLPKYLYRPDDLEKFVLVNGWYYLEDSLLSFPDNLHTKYSYSELITLGFVTSLVRKEKTREEHIAEFWQSFYQSIESAHGSVRSFHNKMTLQEVADTLAQNGIRFQYVGLK